MLGHKTGLKMLTKTEIISSIFSDHGVKLEINDKRENGKFTSMWRLNNMLLNQ